MLRNNMMCIIFDQKLCRISSESPVDGLFVLKRIKSCGYQAVSSYNAIYECFLLYASFVICKEKKHYS